MTAPYNLTVIQPRIRRVFDDQGVFHRDAITENLDHHSELILAGSRYNNSKLFVLPEFSLQGFAGGVSIDNWIEASVRVPGPETDHMGRIAKETGAYIAFMVYEYMPDWPGRYWNTAVIVSPDGEVVHRIGSGIEPVWCANGDVFYREAGRWFRIPITLEPSLAYEPAVPAFEVDDFLDTPGVSYDVSSDGRRLYYVSQYRPDVPDRVRIIPDLASHLP